MLSNKCSLSLLPPVKHLRAQSQSSDGFPFNKLALAFKTGSLTSDVKYDVNSNVGTTREALSLETTRVYGFNRVGQNITLAMSEAVDLLIKTGRIEELEGKLRIKK